jgi:hypothetical protein
LYGEERYIESIFACRLALDLRPGYPEAWNNIGVAYNELGRYEEAAARLRASVALQAGRRKGADQSAIHACKIKDVGKIDKPLNEEVCFWAEPDCSEFKNRASRI